MTAQLNLTTVKLGNNADTSKNFLISVPAIADGTLTITRENGTAIANIDTAGKVVFPANAQTLQNVAASRAIGTVYTNTTSLPITVMVTIYSTIDAIPSVIINGLLLDGTTQHAGWRAQITFVVLPGSTYQVTMPGAAAINNWLELR